MKYYYDKVRLVEYGWMFNAPFIRMIFRSFSAITLLPFAIYFEKKISRWTLAHELIHVKQIRDEKYWFIWYFKYIYNWISHGFNYKAIPYEVEAYSRREEYYELIKDVVFKTEK